MWSHLDKEWNGVESPDDDSVVDVAGQDVQSSCAAFHDLLHADALLVSPAGGQDVATRYIDDITDRRATIHSNHDVIPITIPIVHNTNSQLSD